MEKKIFGLTEEQITRQSGDTFIERLTDEQIDAFLQSEYPKDKRYSSSFIKNKEYIYVSIDENNGDRNFHFTLYDFCVIGCSRSSIWIKYLYQIFGEEYKQAYLADCAKVFD